MGEFTVTIEETIYRVYKVKADSVEEATQKAFYLFKGDGASETPKLSKGAEMEYHWDYGSCTEIKKERAI